MSEGEISVISMEEAMANPDLVIVNIPEYCINANSASGTLPLKNLFAVDREMYIASMLRAVNIFQSDQNAQYDAYETLQTQWLEMVANFQSKSSDNIELFNVVAQATDLTNHIFQSIRKCTPETVYVDINNVRLDFDAIRKYEVDPQTGLLIGAQCMQAEINGRSYEFYSQITDPETFERVREMMNCTNVTQAHHVMGFIVNYIAMEDKFVPQTTIQYVTLLMTQILLALNGRAIHGHSSTNSLYNFIGVIFDSLLRTRVIQRWHEDSVLQALLRNLANDHDKRNISVALTNLPEARDRFNLCRQRLISLPDVNKDVATFAENFTYDDYLTILESSRLTLEEYENASFYRLEANYVQQLIVNNKALTEFLQKLNSQALVVDE